MKVFVFLSMLIAIALGEQCQMMCPMDYSPLCGDDGVTYSNECSLKSTACMTKTTIKVLHEGECTDEDKPKPVPAGKKTVDRCLRPCPRDYSPVCGTDGKTYSNECEMSVEACRKKEHIKVAYQGECGNPRPELFKDKCMKPCTADYSPQCGTDGVTYANNCDREVAECRKKIKIEVAYEGECMKKEPRKQARRPLTKRLFC